MTNVLSLNYSNIHHKLLMSLFVNLIIVTGLVVWYFLIKPKGNKNNVIFGEVSFSIKVNSLPYFFNFKMLIVTIQYLYQLF